MEATVQYRITVKGRVQGVGFRWSALREASALGVSGFVRNMPDGSVYIEAEGTRANLDLLVAWCHEGPGLGHVSSVNVSEYPCRGHAGFEVRH